MPDHSLSRMLNEVGGNGLAMAPESRRWPIFQCRTPYHGYRHPTEMLLPSDDNLNFRGFADILAVQGHAPRGCRTIRIVTETELDLPAQDRTEKPP
jgi:hypothetical protein